MTRRVDAAGAATKVTSEVPFNAPSLAPSVRPDELLSAHAAVNSGLFVAAAPDITAVMVFVVASRTKVDISIPYERNHANALLPPPADGVAHESVPDPFVDNTWLGDPSALGSVQVTFAAIVAAP